MGAVLAEQHDDSQEARRYMFVELLAKARMRVIEGETIEEVMPELAVNKVNQFVDVAANPSVVQFPTASSSRFRASSAYAV